LRAPDGRLPFRLTEQPPTSPACPLGGDDSAEGLAQLAMGPRAVEREFGRLKNEWALLPPRVRGLERVQLHADLTILAKLSCALARARAAPIAA
jgi:hypothetical protein